MPEVSKETLYFIEFNETIIDSPIAMGNHSKLLAPLLWTVSATSTSTALKAIQATSSD